jgi:hypothetical protein
MKSKLIISILLSVLFIKAFAQDTCECKNLKINLTTENLFNEVRIVKTRNQLDSFILDPVEITVKFNYTDKYYTYNWAFPQSFDEYYWNKTRPKKFNTDSFIIPSFISDLKNPLVVIKPAHKNMMYNAANIENGNIHNYFSLYKKDNEATGSIFEQYNLGIDSLGCEYPGGRFMHTYKYIYDRNDLINSLLNDSLQLYYFQIPNEFLTKLGAKKCYIKSNLFALPPHHKDTLVYIDRLDTSIDKVFYKKYPYQNSLMEDVCYYLTENTDSYRRIINYQKYTESLLLKHHIKLKKKEFIVNNKKEYLIISKKFKIYCTTSFSDSTKLMIKKIIYYPSKKEYMFLGLYEGDYFRYQLARIYQLTYPDFYRIGIPNQKIGKRELDKKKIIGLYLWDAYNGKITFYFNKRKKTISKIEIYKI